MTIAKTDDNPWWKWTEIDAETVSKALRKWGISESFISPEASYAAVSEFYWWSASATTTAVELNITVHLPVSFQYTLDKLHCKQPAEPVRTKPTTKQLFLTYGPGRLK